MMTPGEDERCWGAMPDDADLVDWYGRGHAGLVDALERAPLDLRCWSFLPAPSPLAFWARRQAHEATIHRVDAELATGSAGDPTGVTEVATDVAVDGLDELLLCFFARRNRVRTDQPRTLAIAATDTDATWLVHLGLEGARAKRGTGPSDGQLSGPAAVLYLGLWNRHPLDHADFAGDASLLELWREKATILWT